MRGMHAFASLSTIIATIAAAGAFSQNYTKSRRLLPAVIPETPAALSGIATNAGALEGPGYGAGHRSGTMVAELLARIRYSGHFALGPELQKVIAAMAARREFDVFLQIHGRKG